MQLDIVTPEKTVFSEKIETVTLPGTAGEFGVLPGHATLFTTLDTGEILVQSENQEYLLAVSGGFAEVVNDEIIVLADAAEIAFEIDVKRAEAAKIRAEETLKSLEVESDDYQEASEALKRAANRITVSQRTN